jgi:hypothetical protein
LIRLHQLHVSAGGTIWLTRRHRWTDGTTHLRFDPLELLERLAALLNSMPPGEGVASREERCRRAAVVLFPNDDFPWVFPPPWR